MIWAALGGALVGSVPSAGMVARARGIDLFGLGSGNPGTANALQVGGAAMAATVLALDLAKGATAVLTGWALAGSSGAALAGIAAVAGQIINPWHRFRGGKGLGVAAGVSLVAWPAGLAVGLPVVAVAARALGSARGALVGLTTYLTAAAVWVTADLPVAWGIPAEAPLLWMAAGICTLAVPKFAISAVRRR